MAKEDFCFTYYDGDATRDMSHMNRLERGCYTDIIISIRKFGHVTIDQIKKTLSKDFEDCWPAIEIVLKTDEAGKFYLEWLENSLVKMRKQSKTQKDKKTKYWEELKQNENNGNTTVIPHNNNGCLSDKPIEDGNEDDKEEFGKGAEKPFAASLIDTDLLLEKVLLDPEFKREFEQKGMPPGKFEEWLKNFNKFLRHDGITKKIEQDYRRHFTRWINFQNDFSQPEKYSPVKDFNDARSQTNKQNFTRKPAGSVSGSGGY